ncbi:MAG: restriction endonuclease subunit S [Chloroflexi bacterium]|nr:restriction endonuclease subunit S [Chloroflexota bacterium]
MKPYPAYKDSGVPWLGEIPAHWEVRRAKQLFQSKKEINRDRAHKNILSLTLRGVVNNDPDNPEGLVPKDYASYQFFQKNDLVFKLIDLENLRTSRVGLVHEDGIMSPAYVRLSPHHNGIQRYFFHQYYDLWLRGIYNQLGAGVRSTLGQSDLLNLGILFPPPDEQSAIVRYLDHANQRIDRYIRVKRKLIALLNEQKQAIIHRAVTRGLASNVRLKPSGVAWLGDVPEHWEVLPIGRFAKVGNGSTPSRGNIAYWRNGCYPWLNSSQVNRGTIDSADQFVTETALQECHLPRVTPGSVLVAITGQGKTRGTSALLQFEATINQHIAFITPRSVFMSSEYLHLTLTGAYTELRTISEDSGSTKGALTCQDLKRFKIPIAPLAEQNQIVEAITQEAKPIQDAIARAEREIELIREYRTRLIADVVTGKVDVRAAAEQLPQTEIAVPETPSEIENNEIVEETECPPTPAKKVLRV